MPDADLKQAIENCLRYDYQLADGTIVKGQAESLLAKSLRHYGLTNVPSGRKLGVAARDHGFELVYAKAGRQTKTGYSYYLPCRAWVKQTPENMESVRKFKA
jgi:hypothetical protein